jgi:hypothetical protein
MDLLLFLFHPSSFASDFGLESSSLLPQSPESPEGPRPWPYKDLWDPKNVNGVGTFAAGRS